MPPFDMATDRTTEIRLELPVNECSVLDGYVQSKGTTRTAVLRRLLKEWSDEKHMEAIMIVRVAGSNPGQSDKG